MPTFRLAPDEARLAVHSEIQAVNERGGLLHNPDRAIRLIGVVLRRQRGMFGPKGSFERGRPAPRVEEGLDFRGDGLIGGLRPIQDAVRHQLTATSRCNRKPADIAE